VDLKDVIKAIEEQADDIANHNSRICNIEVNKGMVEVQIQNLIKSMDSLTASIKLMLFGALGTTIGFLIWYIQNK
jgi:hypothetical protein